MSRRLSRFAVAAALMLVAGSSFAAADAISLIPADAVSVGVVRVADLRTSPLSSMLFEHADRFGGNGEAEQFLSEAGLDLAKDIDVLVVATAPTSRLGSEAEIVVLADGRFATARLTDMYSSRAAHCVRGADERIRMATRYRLLLLTGACLVLAEKRPGTTSLPRV